MGRTSNKIIAPFLLAALFFSACEKVDNNKGNNGAAPPSNNVERSVYVVCEGSLGNGNSSLWAHTPGRNITYSNVYQSANGELLGDVFQSMELIGNKLFLCVNNSDKIVVLNEEDKKELGVIDLYKPRYIQPISATKAYVTSLFGNKVHIIDPEQMTLKGEISMPFDNPEGIALIDDRVYVCCWDTSCTAIYSIDIATDAIVDSVMLPGAAPHDIVVDNEKKVWVMAGNATNQKWSTLSYINPKTKQVIKQFQFEPLADATRIAYSSAEDRLFYLLVDYNGYTDYNGVYTISRQDTKLPHDPLIGAKKYQYYWGLAIDPVTNDLYVSDPKGFVQKGSVSIYNTDGSVKSRFDVGVGPGNFYFDK